jgi:hypothetical protein
MFNYKFFHLGYFDTEAEAHRVGRAGRDACFEKEYARLCAGGRVTKIKVRVPKSRNPSEIPSDD